MDADRNALAEMVRKSGQSGVPVIEIDGQIVVGFDRARLQQLITGAAHKISLGAAIADATKILAKQGKIPVFGAYIGRVNPGSPAQKAGLEAGDIITEINMRPINSANDVEAALSNMQPGATAQIVFMREEKTLRAMVRF